MTTKPDLGNYRRRIVDEELDALLPSLPAISIEGPKGVGKTATALTRSSSSTSWTTTGNGRSSKPTPDGSREGQDPSSSTNGNDCRRAGTSYDELLTRTPRRVGSC